MKDLSHAEQLLPSFRVSDIASIECRCFWLPRAQLCSPSSSFHLVISTSGHAPMLTARKSAGSACWACWRSCDRTVVLQHRKLTSVHFILVHEHRQTSLVLDFPSSVLPSTPLGRARRSSYDHDLRHCVRMTVAMDLDSGWMTG